ncbi:hypothetical protein [Microbacterium sp.]|uniref:hypothetical protein n=1 Tax=Microbacterium sp. TaxID=51671 RepID=UPI0028120D36|nr:hypothetical protein [Microbacterium sp.]
MNTLTLPRSTAHPPDTQDQTVLSITVPSDRRELALADRLSLRLGLWLLLRAQQRHGRSRRRVSSLDGQAPVLFGHGALTPGETQALLTYDLQRQLR